MVYESSCWLYRERDRPQEVFLARFFKDDIKVSVSTLLSIKQKKGESIKAFVERFLEYGVLISKWHDTVYTGRDLSSQPANHIPKRYRSNSKSHLKATGLTRRTSKRHSCKSKLGRLQEHVALNLLGKEVIRLLRLSRSTVTFE